MDDVIDDIADFAEDLGDAITSFVEDVWLAANEKLLEEVFNLLGFEDETILSAYVATSRLYDTDWIVPWKKIPINRIRFNTTISDEILNVFISGDHVRIRVMNTRIARLGWTPTVSFLNGTINSAEVDIIITGIEGEPITIQEITVGYPSLLSYGKEYLLNNSITTGYTYDILEDTLDDGAGNIYQLIPDVPFVFDVIADAYDVYVYGSPVDVGQIATARNLVADPADTYNVNLGPPIIVTVDTAVDNWSIPVVTAVNIEAPYSNTYNVSGTTVTIDTAVDIGNLNYSVPKFYSSSQTLILQDLIPAQVAPRKQYEVTYTIDSEPSPRTRRYWFYALENPPYTYPNLYSNIPAFPLDSDRLVLPIVPIKAQGQWIYGQGNQLERDTKSVLKRYGMSLRDFTEAFTSDGAGNSNELRSIFFMFGINIATVNTQVELEYLWNFLSEFAYTGTADLDENGFLQLESDIALANVYLRGRIHWVEERFKTARWTFQNTPDDARMAVLLATYIGPDYEDLRPRYVEPTLYSDIGYNLEHLIELMENARTANHTTYTISHNDFNMTLSYGTATQSVEAGVIGAVGTYATLIEPTNYVFNIRRQIDAGNYDQIRLTKLAGFSYVNYDATSLQLTRLDFIGSDSNGRNVRNNFVIPITYGFLLRLGIVDRQQLLYQTARIQMFGINVTELRYYETPSFIQFFNFVLKVAAVIYTIYSGGDISGAQILWNLAKVYGTKLLVEKILQEILLANPDSQLAQVLAITAAIVITAYGSNIDLTSLGIDQALLAIDATSQAYSVYTRVQSDLIQQELDEATLEFTERSEDLKEAIDALDTTSPALLDYIKEQIILSVSSPETFYRKHLTRSLVEEALNLDNFTDVTKLLDLDMTTTVVATREF